ncbi:DUF1176 domain-containing protein [Roseibium sediminis]|uniref:DUF1176 domain-containing protein n=1 Tax=Roseibium sediminis TaxID=1775174 RepID=UPI0013755578|nr:DUF1176 domain-containing protein [Roseibium sediminis]
MRLLKRIAALGIATCAAWAPNIVSAAEQDYEIALKLFGYQDVGSAQSECRLVFWQHNRDPGEDRYSLLLHAPKPDDGRIGDARLKIGGDFHTLRLLVHGGDGANGFGEHYLFATDDRDIKVQVEVLDVDFQADLVRFDKVKLTVIKKGRVPFTANAKGESGCPPVAKPAITASLPQGLSIGEETPLDDVSKVPGVLRQLMRDYAQDHCDIDGFFAWGGARYIINDAYLLWQVPCTSGAYQASGVFGVTQNPPGSWGELLTLPNPPRLEGNQNYAAMSATVFGKEGHIVTTDLNRGAGDCGVRQTFRLIDGPGEVLELELLEFREKYDCDGNAIDPARWPVAYSVR